MDLLEILNIDSSRYTVDVATEAVGSDPARFSEVFDHCFSQPYPVSMRAARVVQFCCERYPDLIYPHLEESFEKMLQSKVEGVKRGFLKIYAENIDLKRFTDPGALVSLCFEWLADPEEAISVRVYALDILYRYSELEPDLLNELASLLESLLYDGSTAIRSRARDRLKRIYKR